MDRKEATKQLFDAVDGGNVADVQAALAAGADVNATSTQEVTPLHIAAWYGYAEVVRLLIEHGADVNARNINQESPLHSAAWHGHAESVQLLIVHGADVNAQDKDGEIPQASQDNDIAALLKSAAKQQGHADRVVEERKDKGPPQVGG